MILERISHKLSKENGNSNLDNQFFLPTALQISETLVLTLKCFSKYSFAELCANTVNQYIEDALFKVALFHMQIINDFL